MPMATSAWYTPQTVPNRPTKGELGGIFIDHPAHRAGEEVGGAAGIAQLVAAVARVMARGDDAVIGEVRKRLVGMLVFQAGGHGVERGRVPERFEEFGAAAAHRDGLDRLDDDQVPSGDGHDEHRRDDQLADGIGLGNEVRDTWRFGDGIHCCYLSLSTKN
jgi:hypothetical protein